MSTSSGSVSFLDYSNERSTVKFRIDQVIAGNYTAQATAVSNLQTALGGITLGNIASRILTAEETFISRTPPTNSFAQRESKWLVRSEDTVTHEIIRHEIPTADQNLLTSQSDLITVFPTGVLANFKTAWEAVVVSKAGNPVTLVSLEFVGKRL